MTGISQKPLRVGIVTRSLMMGGAQQHIAKLCQSVHKEQVQLFLYLLCRDEVNDLLPAIPDRVPVRISPFPRHHPRVLKWLSEMILSDRIQLVHSFLWTADAFAALSKRIFRWQAPVVASERGDRGSPSYRGARNYLDRLVTFPTANAFCANSRFGARLLQISGYKGMNTSVIPNGVDLEYIDKLEPADVRTPSGWACNDFVVGAVSRLIDYKGVDVLIRAMALLPFDVKCILVGDGPQRVELERLAKQLRLEERVIFFGTRTEGASFIKGLDLAVLTTRTDTEHCSNSILEYMACGKPVVATRVGGNSELIAEGLTGLLIERDDVYGLAEAVEQLRAQPEDMRRMGCAGRSRIELDFQMANVTDRFVSFWSVNAGGE
jgi:glycosyltransferase involved in cell wall biosynthesis